jgi:hypothetical protein
MKYYNMGIPSKDLPLVQNEIWCMNEVQAPELTNCEEILVISRMCLLQELRESGNKQMLKRVRSCRREYYLLMLYRKTMKLRLVPLPYEANSCEAEPASQ